MSSKHRLTRSFRTLSAALYVANIVVCIRFILRHRVYLNILVAVITAVLSLVMLMIAVEAPKPAMQRFERSVVGEQLFSFRGRYMVDLFIALFLFAMPPWGIVFGIATLGLIFGIRFLGVKQPDAFNEIFRQSNNQLDSGSEASKHGQSTVNDNYTLESEYDTPVVERR